ncbi:MAG: CPBP family intramembrane metalloprotease, partial [Thermoguttaceae bacterium]|nr:CPBP family intramembrane metalloprotease [Thermoguttaceae bacterium]
MIFSTIPLFGLAPLFGTDGVSNFASAFLVAAPFLYVAFLWGSRRLVGDIFQNDSPAQSPKRLVPWSVGAAFCVFVCGAILFPLLAVNAVSFLPKSWFPDFASVQTVAPPAESAPEDGAPADGAPSTVQTDAERNLATQHPLARLLIRSRSTPWAFETLLLCFFVAVIAAPFAEEFLFRVLLQGTLENYALQAVLPPPGTSRRPFADATTTAEPKNADDAETDDATTTAEPENADDATTTAEPENADDAETDDATQVAVPNVPDVPSATEFRWLDPTTPMERRAFYLRSAFAILVPAFVFGLIHAGAPETPEEARDPETLNRLFRTMLAAGIANVAALIFGLLVLRRSSGATTGDVGFGPEFTYKAGRFFASLR